MWILDDAFNFVGYAAVPLIALVYCAVRLRHPRVAVAIACIGLVLFGFVASTRAFLLRTTRIEATTLRVINANVLSRNGSLSEIAKSILERSPDIIVFEELRHDLASFSLDLDARYPYQFSTAVPWLTIASRLPLSEPRRLSGQFTFLGHEPLAAELEVDGKRIHFIGVHLANSLGAAAFSEHQEQYRIIAEDLSRTLLPSIVVGDLNATITSPTFLLFLWRTRLRSVSNGPLLPSTFRGVSGLVRLRIDHVLIRGLTASRVKIFSLPGSDHKGIMADIDVPIE